MNSAIRQRALELGFDDCRFAAASPPATAPHFQKWLAAGCHGEMAYLERNASKRADPHKVLANVKTIIALAVSYGEAQTDKVPGASPTLSVSTVNNRGLIARYARFADYHTILGQKLKSLAEFIVQLGAERTQCLWYVDTGPLLERDLAQRAGLGFIGKHTNLISRRLGNWVFLAEILTTLDLAPDPSEKNHCGTCSHCITACPTNAITAPFTLDARRCISYLTIELKGAIPIELRRAIGNRIYGCDDCLAACPWNRFAKEGQLMREYNRPDLATPELLDLLSLDDETFKYRFRGTPMLRAKRRGLLRNVCVALGNIGGESALRSLTRASCDPEPLIAEHARWAIEQIQNRLGIVSDGAKS